MAKASRRKPTLASATQAAGNAPAMEIGAAMREAAEPGPAPPTGTKTPRSETIGTESDREARRRRLRLARALGAAPPPRDRRAKLHPGPRPRGTRPRARGARDHAEDGRVSEAPCKRGGSTAQRLKREHQGHEGRGTSRTRTRHGSDTAEGRSKCLSEMRDRRTGRGWPNTGSRRNGRTRQEWTRHERIADHRCIDPGQRGRGGRGARRNRVDARRGDGRGAHERTFGRREGALTKPAAGVWPKGTYIAPGPREPAARRPRPSGQSRAAMGRGRARGRPAPHRVVAQAGFRPRWKHRNAAGGTWGVLPAASESSARESARGTRALIRIEGAVAVKEGPNAAKLRIANGERRTREASK